jgi:hypothetical protein
MFDKMTDRLGGKIDVIFCVIDEKDSMTYHEVKRHSELEFGYITQCVKVKTYRLLRGLADTKAHRQGRGFCVAT